MDLTDVHKWFDLLTKCVGLNCKESEEDYRFSQHFVTDFMTHEHYKGRLPGLTIHNFDELRRSQIVASVNDLILSDVTKFYKMQEAFNLALDAIDDSIDVPPAQTKRDIADSLAPTMYRLAYESTRINYTVSRQWGLPPGGGYRDIVSYRHDIIVLIALLKRTEEQRNASKDSILNLHRKPDQDYFFLVDKVVGQTHSHFSNRLTLYSSTAKYF